MKNSFIVDIMRLKNKMCVIFLNAATYQVIHHYEYDSAIREDEMIEALNSFIKGGNILVQVIYSDYSAIFYTANVQEVLSDYNILHKSIAVWQAHKAEKSIKNYIKANS